MNKKLLLIINPKSGQGLIRIRLLDIVDVFTKAGFDVTVRVTQQPKDAMRYVAEHGAEYDTVIASGGDGTTNEVVTGLVTLEHPPVLGVLPAGSTNDIAHTLGFGGDMLEAARQLTEAEPFLCDTGYMNGHCFAYCAAFGCFTDVCYETPQDQKNLIGNTAYVIQALKNIPAYRSHHIVLEHDGGRIEGDYLLGMISNTISIGGVRRMFDTVANLDDGMVEVTLVRFPMKLTDIQMAINILLSLEHVESREDFVTVVSTSHAKVISDTPVAWTIDGEDGGLHKEVEISVKPKNIPVLRFCP